MKEGLGDKLICLSKELDIGLIKIIGIYQNFYDRALVKYQNSTHAKKIYLVEDSERKTERYFRLFLGKKF